MLSTVGITRSPSQKCSNKIKIENLFTDDDFEHYSQIVTILQRTIELIKNIDKIITNYGGFPIE
jgi:hypothetical protein